MSKVETVKSKLVAEIKSLNEEILNNVIIDINEDHATEKLVTMQDKQSDLQICCTIDGLNLDIAVEWPCTANDGHFLTREHKTLKTAVDQFAFIQSIVGDIGQGICKNVLGVSSR